MKAKKIITTAVAAILALSMAVPVLADPDSVTVESETGAHSFDVSTNISKKNSIDSGEVDYYVSIAWTSTQGIHTISGDTYDWDAGTRKYIRSFHNTAAASEGNTGVAVSINISNQSNAAIDYLISYSNYEGNTDTKTTETTTSGSKAGTLESYVIGNSINIKSDNSGASVLSFSGSGYTTPSAAYEGSVSLANYKADSFSDNPVKLGTYTITVSNHKATRVLENHTTTTLSSDPLLATASKAVTYTYNGYECTAYNGYITSSAYADWNDCKAFVDELNGEGTNKIKILPAGVTDADEGYWRLISCFEEAEYWFDATPDMVTDCGDVIYLWFSSDYTTNGEKKNGCNAITRGPTHGLVANYVYSGGTVFVWQSSN